VAESNENNNRDQGDGVDKDDVTYFPWDIDDDGQVTSVDAIFVINRIGQVVDAGNALADFDGDGQISSTDAIAVINRLGYVRNESALLSAPLQSPQAASSVSGDQFMSAIHMQTQVTNSIQSNARERVYRQLLGDDTDDDDTVDLFAF
jgi:hypothetical protein